MGALAAAAGFGPKKSSVRKYSSKGRGSADEEPSARRAFT